MNIVDLGTEYSYELKQDIQSGTFAKAVVGGRLTLNGHKYLFAHPDYWMNTGDVVKCTSHHMVVIPEDGFLGIAQMETSDTTKNGYALSAMRLTNLASARITIKADFGFNNILSHREYFTYRPDDGLWCDSEVDLMNEIMVYGINACTIIPTSYTIDKSQLMLFKMRPDLIVCKNISNSRNNWWLRDVVSTADFAGVANNGSADYSYASDYYLIRPAFAIC